MTIKSKTGPTGKANLKVYDKNRRGGWTIMVTKVRGGDLVNVKNLAFKVVKYLLDNIIAGELSIDDEWRDNDRGVWNEKQWNDINESGGGEEQEKQWKMGVGDVRKRREVIRIITAK